VTQYFSDFENLVCPFRSMMFRKHRLLNWDSYGISNLESRFFALGCHDPFA